METAQLVAEIATLPPPARQELEQFLTLLKRRYAPLTDEERTRWLDPEFFGMNADRDDMADSVAYVRQLRQNQWREAQ